MDDFEKALRKEVNRVLGGIEKGIAEEIKAGLEKAVEFTPRDTGWMAANYRIGVGTEDIPLQPATRPARGGTPLNADTAAEAQKLSQYKLDKDVIIGNATPHAGFIDEGTSRISAFNIMQRVAQSISERITRRFK